MTTNIMMVRGQALSTWPVSGSHEESNRAILGGGTALHTLRIQGFKWSGASTLTVTDAQGTVLFKKATTGSAIWPTSASGSHGLTCNAPLYISSIGPAGGGGTLIVYGEVL